MSEKSVNEDNLQGSWVELHYSGPSGGPAAREAESRRPEEETPCSTSGGPTAQEAESHGAKEETQSSTLEMEPVPLSTLEAEQVPSSTQGEEWLSGSTLEMEQITGSTLEMEQITGSTLDMEQITGSTLDMEQITGSTIKVEQVPGLTLAGTHALIQGVDLEKMLLDAQHESGRSSSRSSLPCDSPPRPQTPLHLRCGSEAHSSAEKNSSQSDEDYLERRHEVENLMKKNADWIWDWSSRPENLPPKEFLLKHPKRTTPLSIRNTSVMKKGGIFSTDFFKVFLPSLLLSHILAIGLGVYIGRRLTPPSSSF